MWRNSENGTEGDESEGDDNGKGSKRKTAFISVHLGAGEHSLKLKGCYQQLIDNACCKGMQILKSCGSSGEAVAAAVRILEDSGVVNAGRGSNLTIDGTVECDAGFMYGDGYFGAVGGMPGVPNPVFVAKSLADTHKTKRLFECGRIPPNFLTGTAAKSWAATSNIDTCENETLVSERAKKRFQKYKQRLKSACIEEGANDTIGAIALDYDGTVASAVSSGGHWMKIPGRIGHSPIFGCGCYSVNQTQPTNAIAISTSGSGEMLSRVRLPQECAIEATSDSSAGLLDSIVRGTRKHFLENSLLNIHSEPRYIGLISLAWDGAHGEFVWAHSTKNFVFGYSNSRMRSVKMIFSELGENSTVGRSLKAEGLFF